MASARNLAGRLLHIRDDAYASLHGGAPSFVVTHVDENVDANTLRRVLGTFTVPNYLTGTGQPGSSFNYAPGETGPNALPTRNGDYTANFRCLVPRSASADGNDPVNPARGIANGHGLLGSANEVEGFGPLANQGNSVICGTDEIGMSGSDLPNVAALLGDLSHFGTLADRLQQGILNMQFLARLLKHPDGFASDPAFQAGAAHTPVIKTGEVYFNGNSQGGILGGAITAVSTEFTRAVLGVPAVNYSTLLNRSVDYTQFSGVSTNAYPDPIDQQFDFSLVQMLWDRGEGDGYTQHLTDDPYPDTPRHQVLLIEAFGDHQVANIGTETFARSIGATVWQPALGAGSQPGRRSVLGHPTRTVDAASRLGARHVGLRHAPSTADQHGARGTAVRPRSARHGPRQPGRRPRGARVPAARRRVRRRVRWRALPRPPLTPRPPQITPERSAVRP